MTKFAKLIDGVEYVTVLAVFLAGVTATMLYFKANFFLISHKAPPILKAG